MDWCWSDWGCWMIWLDDTGVRLAQVAVSLWIGWLALSGPKNERDHQARMNLVAKVEHAISVLRVLAASGERLKETGRLIDDWLKNDKNRENAQLRRIRANLELDEGACSAIPLAELPDHELIGSVLEVSMQSKLLILAIDDYLKTFTPRPGEPYRANSVDRDAALKNLGTATLYLHISEVDKLVNELIEGKLLELQKLGAC